MNVFRGHLKGVQKSIFSDCQSMKGRSTSSTRVIVRQLIGPDGRQMMRASTARETTYVALDYHAPYTRIDLSTSYPTLMQQKKHRIHSVRSTKHLVLEKANIGNWLLFLM